MNAIEKMRKAFDDCTVMAGVENEFECVYITKNAALSYLTEIEEENAKLRELLRDAWACSKCGALVDAFDKYCKLCGAKFTDP